VGDHVLVDEVQARGERGVERGRHVVLRRGGVYGIDPVRGVVHGQVGGVAGGVGAEEVTEGFRARPVLLAAGPVEGVGDGVVLLGAGPAVVVHRSAVVVVIRVILAAPRAGCRRFR
jgi:hypothetical protein